MTALLEAYGLHRRFPLRGRRGVLHAVEDVSFQLARGEALGLVGESGCGKSTLARLVARLLDADEGTILLDGRDLAATPARRFAADPARPRIQMVFQDAQDSLSPRMTAAEAIAAPLRRLRGMRGKALREAVRAAAAECELDTELLGRLPHQLSGGQRARVGIARAVAVRPDVLILDEPTAALDVSVQARILQLLDRLRRDRGMACLFVSHDLGVVRLFCDRVLVMYLGRVAEEGPAHAVFDRAAHPYARALAASLPRLGEAPRPALLVGEPRSPVNPDPHACRLHGRCPRQTALCIQAMPLLLTTGPGRRAACHHPEPLHD
jgi:oligopeptide/dipeptide ABC transporter ATP-binding protein